jgi:CBS domain containing-hemolysin-like protein
MELLIKVFSGTEKVEQMTDDEIESFIDMGKKSCSLEDHEHEKIKNILEFDETTVEEIMTPRVKIEALPVSATISEAMDFYLTHTHSRIPIFNKTIDKIDYFLTARDLVKEFAL